MSSFKVDEAGLESFAELVSRFAGDAEAVMGHIDGHATIDRSEKGMLFGALGETHVLALMEVTRRMGHLFHLAVNSANNVRFAAGWYRDTDSETEAALDGTYTVTTAPYAPEDTAEVGVTDAAYAFKDLGEPQDELREPDLSVVAPQAPKIDWLVHTIGDGVSIAYYLRKFLKDTFGVDPVDEAVKTFAGDWEAYGRCAVVWDNCDKALRAMAENLHYSDAGLAQVWTGNAADNAIAYFQQFRLATLAEADFFGYLRQVYVEYVDITFNAQQIVNDLLNTIIDQALTAVAMAGFAVSTGGVGLTATGPLAFLLWEIWEAIGLAVGLCTLVVDTIRLGEIISSAADLPDGMPPSQLDELGLANDVSSGYQHPEAY